MLTLDERELMRKQMQTLADIGKQCYDRGWIWGAAGNLSVRLKSAPLEIAITPSGVNKGYLSARDILTIRDTPGMAHT